MNKELNEYMAEVMGWHDGKDPMHGQDCWNNKDGKCVKLKKDWHPAEDLNQAMTCADKISAEIGIYKHNDMWGVTVNSGSYSPVHFCNLSLVICVKIREALEVK